MNVGPVQLRGKTASPSFALSGATWSSKVMWFDLPYTKDADGVISPYHLPYNQIIFHMAGRGETTRFRLRMDYNSARGIFLPVRVHGKKIAVRFSVSAPESFATGAAGALLAQQYGGRYEGPPVWHQMGWGVIRPARRLVLGRFWVVGSFKVSELLMRHRDFRGKHAMPVDDTAVQPGDIVVTGTYGPRQEAEAFLTLGMDVLHGCRSLIYSRGNEGLEFRC